MKSQGEPRFLWGAATSSHQIEGDNRFNDWWAWEAKGVVDGGVKSGKATDHLNRFREDLRFARELGLNTYRFSIEWSRLEPREGHWDSAALDWYSELVSECEKLGLLPMATLHHFTSPQWLAEQGGFSSDAAPEKFAAYVRKVANSIGTRIPLWCTLNEPMVLVAGSYLGSFMPPGIYEPEAASKACHNLLKAHVLAYDILKTEIGALRGPFKGQGLQVGFAHNMLDFMPDRRWHLIEVALAKAFSGLYNGAWLEAVSGKRQKFGFPGVFPFAPQLSLARGRKTYDFIGVNYYTKAHVQWRPRTHAKERDSKIPMGLSFARRKDVASDLDWALHPAGFRRVLESLRRYDVPVYVTENGVADSQDQYRRSYLQSHLMEVAHARARGLDIRGYYHWSLLDNFEWIKGFWPRFGLLEVDYETFERTPRPSASFYRDIIEAHDSSPPDQEILTRMAQGGS